MDKYFFIIILKVNANKVEKTAIKISTALSTCNQLSYLSQETFVITVGVGPQDKVLIKLATKTYHVVKILKLYVRRKIQKDSRAQNNNTISLLTTTTLLKRTKNISSIFSLFICEYFVSKRYQ